MANLYILLKPDFKPFVGAPSNTDAESILNQLRSQYVLSNHSEPVRTLFNIEGRYSVQTRLPNGEAALIPLPHRNRVLVLDLDHTSEADSVAKELQRSDRVINVSSNLLALIPA